MASVDIEINRDCVVRKNEYSVQDGALFELRVGEPGWHRNAALLDVDAAIRLRAELDDFIRRNGGPP